MRMYNIHCTFVHIIIHEYAKRQHANKDFERFNLLKLFVQK